MPTKLMNAQRPGLYVRAMALACLFVAVAMMPVQARGQATETVLHSFRSQPGGRTPQSGVIRDSGGNLFGTTFWGGQYGNGVVYKMDPTGRETVLYNFTGGADGSNPQSGLVADSARNLYGTTLYGGANGSGVVFKIDASGKQTVLYSLPTGTNPVGGVVLDPAGNLYGVSSAAVFKLDTNGQFTFLHSFTGSQYAGPQAGLIYAAGYLFGTTYQGGTLSLGTVFRMDTSGNETVLHNFGATGDGSQPAAALTIDSGNLYGTTSNGGAGGSGTVFKIDRTGHETVLYSFPGGAGGANPGGGPGGPTGSGVVIDAQGDLYGTTQWGGVGSGVLYKLDTTGHETVLHTFTGNADGGGPAGGVILDAAGNLYGTNSQGGKVNNHEGGLGLGVLYEFSTTTQKLTVLGFWGATSGSAPLGMTPDGSGNLYGVTESGGVDEQGVVFKLDAVGKETLLHSFTGGLDGGVPVAGVIRDAAGNLYGTTFGGGSGNSGVVYEIDVGGHYKVLYAFTGGHDGANPAAGVIRDEAGNLYGTTFNWGGVVFKVDATGHETVLYTFAGGASGSNPSGPLIRDSAGNLYGTTNGGGIFNCGFNSGCGVVFKLDITGHETVLYTFTGGSDEGFPSALIRDSAGNLFGTAGDCTQGQGEVFEVSAASQFSVLHSFPNPEGGCPMGNLILDSGGNLYGTTFNGGTALGGTAYKLEPAGTFSVLYSFTGGADGSSPNSLIRDSAGNLYGTTIFGGASGGGVIFKITPQ